MTQNANTAIPDPKNQASAFRLWVQNIWIQNCEERLTFNEPSYKIKEYWHTYKYWLKRKYKQQRDSL